MSDFRRAVTAVVVFLMLLSGAQHSTAQSATQSATPVERLPPYRFRILGVYDMATGTPVDSADVIDVMSGNLVKTTSTGTASLLFLPDGGALVRVRKLGFEAQTLMVSISPQDTLPVTLVLKRVVELPTIVTIDSANRFLSPGLRSFENRRLHSATGHFMTTADFRKEEGRPLGMALLAHIPTISISTGRSSAMLLQKSAHCGAGGPPDVYLDGVRLVHPTPVGGRGGRAAAAGSGAIDLSEFDVSTLAGAEYYPTTSAAPAEYGGTTGACGVLLLWSRERL